MMVVHAYMQTEGFILVAAGEKADALSGKLSFAFPIHL